MQTNNNDIAIDRYRVGLLTVRFINKSISTNEHRELDDLIENNDNLYTLFEQLICFRHLDELNDFLRGLGVKEKVKTLINWDDGDIPLK